MVSSDWTVSICDSHPKEIMRYCCTQLSISTLHDRTRCHCARGSVISRVPTPMSKFVDSGYMLIFVNFDTRPITIQFTCFRRACLRSNQYQRKSPTPVLPVHRDAAAHFRTTTEYSLRFFRVVLWISTMSSEGAPSRRIICLLVSVRRSAGL